MANSPQCNFWWYAFSRCIAAAALSWFVFKLAAGLLQMVAFYALMTFLACTFVCMFLAGFASVAGSNNSEQT